MHYNTTSESGAVLRDYENKALKLEDRIHKLFLANPTALATPCQVMKKLGTGIPITSYRRAMTNLTDQGKLTKTDQKKKGQWGRMVHLWTLNN